MAQGKPEELPESIIVGQFAGMKNIVSAERLSISELEKALNIDLDDAGQARRRRGRSLVSAGDFHSLFNVNGTVYGVKNSALGIVRPDYSFASITPVSHEPISYTSIADSLYFSSLTHAGILEGTALTPWGATVDGLWLSPVVAMTDTLGGVSGKLLGNPPKATQIEAYSGRIYMAHEKTLWATELYLYNYVDRTRNFMQFEHVITLLMAVNDGLFVGTDGGLYFLAGVLGNFKLQEISRARVLPGSGVRVPAELVHPQAKSGPTPASEAVVLMTDQGICACFDGGTVYNLTQGQMAFPRAGSAAALFRQQDGANSYVAVADSRGTPTAKARIGDYVDAEIIRASQGG